MDFREKFHPFRVSCAKVENKGDIRDNFFERCKDVRDIPAEKFKGVNFDPNLFD